MLRALKLTALMLLVLFLTPPTQAVVDPETPLATATDYELVVVEVENCIYCGLFRRDVLPAYQGSKRGRAVPIRFIDINAPDVEKLQLSAPIDSVPTVLVLKSGTEVGRIPGYVGPENFFHSINRLLPELH
jgi:thioredoxin-related protein